MSADPLSNIQNVEPMDVAASAIFFLAVCHTFAAPLFIKLSQRIQRGHLAPFVAKLVHACGEIELIFGIWAIPLMLVVIAFKGWDALIHYLANEVSFVEPLFVVVIMAAASTRPILDLAESCLRRIAALGKGSASSWWLTILTLGPLTGSLITEPAAMTISALLLGKQFYRLQPSKTFGYATLGLLFVNVSVGGTLTNFAAPPVLMVVKPWDWSSQYVLTYIGWKVLVGVMISNLLYFLIFRREFSQLEQHRTEQDRSEEGHVIDGRRNGIPIWVQIVHVLAMGWIVVNLHRPPLFLAGFLFLLGFMSMTRQHQRKVDMRGPLLVGFFLAGLVIHGGFQAWWISPMLGDLGKNDLLFVSTFLTSFNDNAAITYLSTFVQGFSDEMKIAVVSGAVAGGGLTVIANAPNPAGAAILGRFFNNKVVLPLNLALAAMIPTAVMVFCFLIL
ncbi:MAG: putative Na+/H+ antiporter [Oligoflexales bacterium]